jgi:hypothetical protein
VFEKAKEDMNVKNQTSYLESSKHIPAPIDSEEYFRETYERHMADKKPYNNMKGIINHHYMAEN